MIINNYIGKRVYFKKEDLVKKAKEKPIFYTIDVLRATKKDGEKTYLTKEDFDRIGLKYKNKTNIFLKTKWFFQTFKNSFLTWWKTRKFKTTKEIADYRLKICEACPELSSTRNCNVCGCFVDAKTKLLVSECPLKKW
jgi:hypothetical protein